MIWSVLAMITGIKPQTTSVPFKVLLVTLFAVARVDTRIKQGTEGRKHTGRWLFSRSISFACSVRQQRWFATGVFYQTAHCSEQAMGQTCAGSVELVLDYEPVKNK